MKEYDDDCLPEVLAWCRGHLDPEGTDEITEILNKHRLPYLSDCTMSAPQAITAIRAMCLGCCNNQAPAGYEPGCNGGCESTIGYEDIIEQAQVQAKRLVDTLKQVMRRPGLPYAVECKSDSAVPLASCATCTLDDCALRGCNRSVYYKFHTMGYGR